MNVYGWFVRVERIYALSDSGRAAVARWASRYRRQLRMSLAQE
jgi:hypothetical protein